MSSLEWYELIEKFYSFKRIALHYNFYVNEIEKIEKSLEEMRPFNEAIKDAEKLVEKDRPHFLVIKGIKDGVIEIDGPAPYWFRSLAENGTLVADTLKLPEGDIRLYPYDIVKYDNGTISVVHLSDV
jgi:hypothetical protein